MTHRLNPSLRGILRWFAPLLVCASSTSAWAQGADKKPEPGAAEKSATEDEDEGMEYKEADEGEGAGEEPEPAKAEQPAAEPQTPQPEPAAEPMPEVPPPPPMGDDETVAFMGVERLPSSAYPEPRTRGIVGGSLWMTMHGLQWPYMPYIQGSPALRVGISGSAWVDTSYRTITSTLSPFAGEQDTEKWLQQGRAVLRATPTFSTEAGWFVQGQAELVANSDQTQTRGVEIVDPDDLYVRAGRWDLFDVTAGRFQGWEVYHFGMGLDLNTVERTGAAGEQGPPTESIYGVTRFWDRPLSAGNIAFHLYPTDFVRFEVLGQLGNAVRDNVLAVRPVGILDVGLVKLKLGMEYGYLAPYQREACAIDPNTGLETCTGNHPRSETDRGWGGALQFVIDPYVEFGVNAAQALVDKTIDMIDPVTGEAPPDLAGSTTKVSYGGFANGRIVGDLIAGVGLNYTYWHDLQQNPDNFQNNEKTHLQGFFALQYAFWKLFYIKGVFGYAKAEDKPFADNMPVIGTNTMYSGRLRLMITF